ncbi:MAG: DUF1553 domain-containing protein [Fuerstiella sp.]
MKFLRLFCALTCGFASTIGSADDGSQSAAAPDFRRVIKPLLSDRCFLCHGPDAENRQAGLRLDSPEGLCAPLESDDALSAVVPGHPERSVLVERILSGDPDLVMPPSDSGLKLSAAEKQQLVDWVKSGAEWKQHWAFAPIERPTPPELDDSSWVRSPIDAFILKQQREHGLDPNPETSRERWLRRVSFDLIGLPPTLEQLDQFLQDDSEGAYEAAVDRLLASPHFGERMAADWLDVARYSDTYGYQVDRDRFVWPWRDWVVRAFNQNMPYDQFITEQLAGDLIPDASRDQILATTFNRLHPQKVEGGSVPEEFRVEYVADRAQTVGTAFLGLTFECCRCHDHKYDPLSQREYYQFFSYFNNIDEAGLYSYFTNSVPTPTLKLPTRDQEQKLESTKQQVQAAAAELRDYQNNLQQATGEHPLIAQLLQKREQRLADPTKLIPGQIKHLDFESGRFGANRVVDSDRGKVVQLTGDHGIDTGVGNFSRWQPFTVATWVNIPKRFERSVIFHRSRAWTDAASRGYETLIEDGRLSAALIHFWPGNAIRVRTKNEVPLNRWTHVAMTYDGSSRASGLQIWIDGTPAATEVVRDNLDRNITGGGGDNIAIGQRFRDIGFKQGMVDDFRVFERQLTSIEIAQLHDGHSLTDRLTDSIDSLIDYAMATVDEHHQKLQSQLQEARQQHFKLQDGIQEIMAMKELPAPRPAFRLDRGAYDAPAEPVSAGVPAALPAVSDQQPQNRLGLARWLTSSEQPLTARVTVNRFWQMCFGHGLVRTPEDFGSQGMLPTHPELLDWLADDFRSHNWDVKRLLKQIVTSATYRQSSEVSAEKRKQDPENLYLSYASVFRLSAEMLRDNALATSGLLQKKIGGPPVRPYELAASFKPSKPDSGEGLYRRSLYTYWKRTAPAPMMMTLDASKREVCRVKRERTASPLQALVVMNGPQFVEASRALADRLLKDHADSTQMLLDRMFRMLTSRQPSERDSAILLKLWKQQHEHFQQQPDAAKQYLSVGEYSAEHTDLPALAATANVANMLFAYDEAMMKR